MLIELIDYTLPEFVFLDGNSHEGDSLKNRTVLQHVRSYTILEVVSLTETKIHNFKTVTHTFTFKNRYGIEEKHLFAVHFSLAEDDQLQAIFESAQKWYSEYLAWEDKGIISDEQGKQN